MFRSYFPIPAITHPPSSLLFLGFCERCRTRGDGMGCSDGRVSEVVIVRLSVRSVRLADRLTNHALAGALSKFGELGVDKSTAKKPTKCNGMT